MEYTHNCIKCKKSYTDNDVDEYYCNECKEGNKKIAKEIDRKLANSPKREAVSNFKAFEEVLKTKGIRGYVNIRDL